MVCSCQLGCVMIKYISKSYTDRIVVLSAKVDLLHTDEIGELVVNLIPKSYNEDNKSPFFLVTSGELKKLVRNCLVCIGFTLL